MARPQDPNRLSDADAAFFRKALRKAIESKGLSYAELAEALNQKNEKWDEQRARNCLRLGPRPLLAQDAIELWRAVGEVPSRRGWDGKNGADFALLKMSTPWPAWRLRYEDHQAGPGVNIPRSEIGPFATAIAKKLARTKATRAAMRRKIEALLAEQSPKMGRRWREIAQDYVGVAAAAASRGEVAWKGRYDGEDVIALQRGVGNSHDVGIVLETLDAVAVLSVPDAPPPWTVLLSSTTTIETIEGAERIVTRWEGSSRAAFAQFTTPAKRMRLNPDLLKQAQESGAERVQSETPERTPQQPKTKRKR